MVPPPFGSATVVSVQTNSGTRSGTGINNAVATVVDSTDVDSDDDVNDDDSLPSAVIDMVRRPLMDRLWSLSDVTYHRRLHREQQDNNGNDNDSHKKDNDNHKKNHHNKTKDDDGDHQESSTKNNDHHHKDNKDNDQHKDHVNSHNNDHKQENNKHNTSKNMTNTANTEGTLADAPATTASVEAGDNTSGGVSSLLPTLGRWKVVIVGLFCCALALLLLIPTTSLPTLVDCCRKARSCRVIDNHYTRRSNNKDKRAMDEATKQMWLERGVVVVVFDNDKYNNPCNNNKNNNKDEGTSTTHDEKDDDEWSAPFGERERPSSLYFSRRLQSYECKSLEHEETADLDDVDLNTAIV